MKFKKAFCLTLDMEISIDDATHFFETDPAFFGSHIKNSLICPNCKSAHLTYANAATPHFRTYPEDTHALDCHLRQDELNAKQVANFLDDAKNEQIIKRQMKSMIVLLMANKKPLPKQVQGNNSLPKQEKEPTTQIKPNAKMRLPVKRIETPFTDSDFGCPKLFYGIVHLVWEEEKRPPSYYKALLFHPKTKKLLCKLKVTNKVLEYVDSMYMKQHEFDCVVAFIATFDEPTGRAYQKTSLMRGQWLHVHML